MGFNTQAKMLMGAVVVSVILTAFVNDTSLNLTGIVKAFASIGAWIPVAVALAKQTEAL